jgi:hypothetical protein
VQDLVMEQQELARLQLDAHPVTPGDVRIIDL